MPVPLTFWFGELLTETYNEKKDQPITIDNFEEVYATALSLLPNTNILNIISKAKKKNANHWYWKYFKQITPLNSNLPTPRLTSFI